MYKICDLIFMQLHHVSNVITTNCLFKLFNLPTVMSDLIKPNEENTEYKYSEDHSPWAVSRYLESTYCN